MMKKFIGVCSLSALALAISATLSACGQAKGSPAIQDVAPQADSQATKSADDGWIQITNLAQSIEGVSFSYDSKSKAAKLGFEHRNLDKFDDKGLPYYTYIFELKGQVGADGSVTLVDERVPDYTGKAKCLDSACLQSEIEIRKASGKLAGSASIKYTTLVNTGSNTGHGDIKDANSTQAQVSKALRTDPFATTLTIKEVVGGRKSFFEIKYEFSNRNCRPQDEDHFDQKWAAVSGEIGKNVLIHLGIGSSKGAMAIGGSSPYHADVYYDPSRSFVGVSFKEQEGLLYLAAGRELFPKDDQKKD
jgi:hypothetical protein